LLIGVTPSGFIYSDPTFSISLGYGLELSADDLARDWDQAARPRQALAFTRQPRVANAHLAQAVAPAPITRVELPKRPVAVAATPTASLDRTPMLSPQARPEAQQPTPDPVTPVPERLQAPGRPGVGLGAGGVVIAAGVLAAITLWRARRLV
jgi:hypothetical protein